MEKHIEKVEVGTYGERAALQFLYKDAEPETHLFPVDLAEQIAAQLAKVCSDLRYVERQIPRDGVSVTDHPTVRIIGHEEGHVDG
jgi:hypothetical protein